MILRSKKDWKQLLPPEDEQRLNELLKKIAKHRGAYRNSDDVKLSQMWAAMLEIHKENLILQKRLNEIGDIFETMFEKIKKKDEEKRKLIESLERF